MSSVVEWMTKNAEIWTEKDILCECLVLLTKADYKSIHDPLFTTGIVKQLLNELR